MVAIVNVQLILYMRSLNN